MRAIVATLSVCLILISLNCSPRYMSTGALGKYVYFPIDPRQLITVEDPTIRQTLNMITSDTTDFRSDFRKLQAWVSSHIVYSNDSYYHWQTPVETLEKRTGNCKDFAVLLCTLSRAAGVPASDIYVAIGKDHSNNAHAFIIEKWILDRWQVVEPQVGGFVISDLTSIDTADRYIIYSRFNDKYYLGETAYITATETFLTSRPASAANSQPAAGSEPVAVSPSPAVNPLPEIDYFYFKQVPNVVGASGATMLAWQVTGSSLVYIDNGIGYVAASGSQIVASPAGTVFTITARNENGEVKSKAFR
ncbi:MAG: transglutaminase-like domain-containing protein [Dehalococcoidia bacterium]